MASSIVFRWKGIGSRLTSRPQITNKGPVCGSVLSNLQSWCTARHCNSPASVDSHSVEHCEIEILANICHYPNSPWVANTGTKRTGISGATEAVSTTKRGVLFRKAEVSHKYQVDRS